VGRRSIIIPPKVKEPSLDMILLKDKKFMDFLKETIDKFSIQYKQPLELEKKGVYE
jgi:hypothetical protein